MVSFLMREKAGEASCRGDVCMVKVLGETGNNVMMRLMGLILMVIAVECFVSGAKPILVDILKEGLI